MREIGCVLAALVLALSSGTLAGEAPRLPGSDSYRLYCAGCHGYDGRGTPAAEGIDLTRLGEKYGQPLATPAMIDRLGARPPLHARWEDDTLICGEPFLRNLTPNLASGLLRRGTVMEALHYLDAIQVDNPPPAS
jgi:hypothetical protein